MSSHPDPAIVAQPVLKKSSASVSSEGATGKERTNSEASSLYDKKGAPLAASGEEPLSVGHAFLQLLGLAKKDKVADLDAVATQPSVFDGPLAEHYPLHPQYENRAAFDPSFRWTYREERAVQRKVDWKILIWVLVMFLALDIDRGNLKNATADGILDDINISQADYNLGNTLFRVGFLVAELPSQLIGKKIGVDIWLPMQICIFSVLSGAQFWLNGRAMFLAFRFTIAAFQGGFIPDVILYLSYYYTKNSLPLRLAMFWSINFFADFVTAFMAVGLLKMRGVLGHAGWRWMFLIEGLITLVIGIASFFMMAPSPSQTKAKWRPKGMFTERETKIIVNRVVRDDPGKATMHNRQALNMRLLWKSVCDYDVWPMYLIGLLFGVAGYPLGNYFQLSMRGLGFSTVMANLLSVPHIAISIVNLIGLTALSEWVNSRTWVCMVENWWFLIFYIPLKALPDPVNPWVWFALATLVLGYPYAHAIQVAWCSRNSGSVRTRTVSASLYNMMVQCSGIIGANLYQANDKPRYHRGNTIILGIVAANLAIVYPGTWAYYKWRNGQKEKKWGVMSLEEKSHYLATTDDEGCKRLDFRFAY
ncbi:hypothetical protein JCM6882_004256 [Rhodosporidiobolus microsporus]